MKTLLAAAALLSLSVIAVHAADAPKPDHAQQCAKIDADLTKVYAGKHSFLTTIKAHHLLGERRKLNCPGDPPPAPAKKK